MKNELDEGEVVSSEMYSIESGDLSAEIKRLLGLITEADPKTVVGVVFAMVSKEDGDDGKATVKQAMMGPMWVNKRLLAHMAQLYAKQSEAVKDLESGVGKTKH